jgi:fructose-1,6-bisphosphatase/inositol monophosphatase family enzyme
VTPDALLELFDAAAAAARDAVMAIELSALRGRTERPGQYALDLAADDAACAVLTKAPVRIVSEESGIHGDLSADVAVVVDPIDGSTNCARGIAYWSTSLCALDRDGPVAALVHNHPANARATAIRGGGAHRDGVRLQVSGATQLGDCVIGLGGTPRRPIAARQARILGSIALELVDVAAGGLDGHVVNGAWVAPWDYLGGLLICREAGGIVRDASGKELVTDDVTARRQIIAAGTPELADALVAAVVS